MHATMYPSLYLSSCDPFRPSGRPAASPARGSSSSQSLAVCLDSSPNSAAEQQQLQAQPFHQLIALTPAPLSPSRLHSSLLLQSPTMEGHNLPELHAFACHLAIEAGSYLRDQALLRTARNPANGEHYDLELEIKENAADLVTKADMHAERMISDAIRERYPEHK